jgi:hypothetical protein
LGPVSVWGAIILPARARGQDVALLRPEGLATGTGYSRVLKVVESPPEKTTGNGYGKSANPIHRFDSGRRLFWIACM